MTDEKKSWLFEQFLKYLEESGVEVEMPKAETYDCEIGMSVPMTFDFDMTRVTEGTVINFKLSDGEPVSAVAVRDDGDSVLFVFRNALKDEHYMNSNGENDNYDDMCDYLQEVANKLPKTLKENLKGIRLLTVGEVFGKDDADYIYDDDEPEQIPYFKDRLNRICKQGEDSEDLSWWWLSNKLKNSAARFAFVGYFGTADSYYASFACGVRPVFSVYRSEGLKEA